MVKVLNQKPTDKVALWTTLIYNTSMKDSFNMLKAGAINLPLMVRRSIRTARTRKHKKHLGKSIDLRDESILHRKKFGHWD